MRPDGWPSSNAAGLPYFPGLVRYDEVFEQGLSGMHCRSPSTGRGRPTSPPPGLRQPVEDPNLPPMGMRVRLRANFDIAGFSRPMQSS
ncbi:MAG: hypothetical protein WKF75_01770 [Singulisphaera sp.]